MAKTYKEKRAADAALFGEVMYLGRYRTRREIYEKIQRAKEWQGAVPFENQTHWGLVLGAASIAILKEAP